MTDGKSGLFDGFCKLFPDHEGKDPKECAVTLLIACFMLSQAGNEYGEAMKLVVFRLAEHCGVEPRELSEAATERFSNMVDYARGRN